MPIYRFSTDAASGEITAPTPTAALKKLIADGEWANKDWEYIDIADGAWLTIFDAYGIPVLRRGNMP